MVNRRLLLCFFLFLFILGVTRPRAVSASVDIVYFRYVSNQNSITLEWGTETELDLLGFLIYRGLDSDLNNADPIGNLIPANGAPPTGGAEYQYEDTSVTQGVTYYYWLASVDISDTGPGEYSFEGPRSATTLGGTTINTPIPTTTGTTPNAPTRTPTATLPPTGSTPVPTTTNAATSPSASPTSTPQPSPTVEIDLSPTRIPAGTFPQPPTPTRFNFPPTATAAVPGSTTSSSTNTNGETSNAGNGGPSMNGTVGQAIPTVALPGGSGEGNPPDSSEVPPSSDSVTTLGDANNIPATSAPGSVDVLGQQIASQPQTSGQLPVPATTTASPAPNIVSPLIIMGLMVGVVFTFGGAITILLMLRRK